MVEKLRIRVFFELMGWPPEKITSSLKGIVTILREKFEWTITNEKYEEPQKITKKMYSSHAEFEAEVKDLGQLVLFVIAYGPSVVEILDPPEFYLQAGELQDILADISGKIQNMDKDIKILSAQNRKMSLIFEDLQKKGLIKMQPPNEQKPPK